MDDQPLVMPLRDALRLDEEIVAVENWKALADDVYDLVVELEEKEVKLRHDDVFVVAWIADQRTTARQSVIVRPELVSR